MALTVTLYVMRKSIGDAALLPTVSNDLIAELSALYKAEAIAGYKWELLTREEDIGVEYDPAAIMKASEQVFPCLLVNVTYREGERPAELGDIERRYQLAAFWGDEGPPGE